MKRVYIIVGITSIIIIGCIIFYSIDSRQPPVCDIDPPQGMPYSDYVFNVENGNNLAYWHRVASRPWNPEPKKVLARYLISYMTRETRQWPDLVTDSYKKDHIAQDKLQFGSSPFPNAFRLVKEQDAMPSIKKYELYVTNRTSVPADTFYSTWVIELKRQADGHWLVNDLL